MLTELPAEVIAFNTTFQIQYSPSHTGNVLGSCTIDFAYCMSLMGTFQNLVTENYNSFIVFSMREWAEFNKSCNLIGGIFSSGLLTAGGNLALIAWACLMTLNFHFFYTDSVYIQRLFFIRQELWKWNFSWNVQFVSRFNTAFTIKRGASQQLKQVISERMGERKKKSYLPAKGRSV